MSRPCQEEIAEAPPAADKARRFRGRAPAGRHDGGQTWAPPYKTCVGRKSRRAGPACPAAQEAPYWWAYAPTGPLIPKPVKKLEKLFIAPKVRQVLYETSQRVFTRCACAQRTGFLIKFFNQESVLVLQ